MLDFFRTPVGFFNGDSVAFLDSAGMRDLGGAIFSVLEKLR